MIFNKSERDSTVKSTIMMSVIAVLSLFKITILYPLTIILILCIAYKISRLIRNKDNILIYPHKKWSERRKEDKRKAKEERLKYKNKLKDIEKEFEFDYDKDYEDEFEDDTNIYNKEEIERIEKLNRV